MRHPPSSSRAEPMITGEEITWLCYKLPFNRDLIQLRLLAVEVVLAKAQRFYETHLKNLLNARKSNNIELFDHADKGSKASQNTITLLNAAKGRLENRLKPLYNVAIHAAQVSMRKWQCRTVAILAARKVLKLPPIPNQDKIDYTFVKLKTRFKPVTS